MNRPIIIIVIGYIIGIIWGLYFKISIVLLYLFIAVLYLILYANYKKQKFKILSIKRFFRYIKIYFKINIILIIIVSSFISNTIVNSLNYKYENLYKDKEELSYTGVIVSNPIKKKYKNRYKVKVVEGKYRNTYLYIDTNIKLEYGDKVNIKGIYEEPEIARNYKGFDYKQYLKTKKIYGIVKVDSIEKLGTNKYRILNKANALFLKIKNNIEKTYGDKTNALIKGVLLGYTADIDDDIKEQFSQSNISHVLAVSGMHISYLIYLATNSTKSILGNRKSKIFASIILIFYMFITGLSVSVVRACIMGSVSCMSFVLYRKNNTLNNIAISALIILINNPFSLLDLSFLLSFGGTIGIIFFEPIIEHFLKSIKMKNRKWRYLFLKIQKKFDSVIKIISVSISSQIIIAPIIVLKFNNLGIAFLFTNLLLSTVIGFIVMGGLIQVLISFISIDIGIAIAKIIEIPTYVLILISKLGEKIPFGSFKVVTPDLIYVFLYYFLIFIIMYLYKITYIKNLSQTQIRIKNYLNLFKYKIKPYKIKISRVIFVLFFIIFCISKVPKNLKIYFIDVGQGDSSLIVTPSNKTILIDGGGSYSYDIGKNVLVPYLLDRKINIIDYMIITHFDMDHVRSGF